jgi:hypothetical protein
MDYVIQPTIKLAAFRSQDNTGNVTADWNNGTGVPAPLDGTNTSVDWINNYQFPNYIYHSYSYNSSQIYLRNNESIRWCILINTGKVRPGFNPGTPLQFYFNIYGGLNGSNIPLSRVSEP